MCAECEDKFDFMATDFEDTLADYRKDIAAGRVRDTPATRVSDFATIFLEMDDREAGRILTAWYLAIAVERLMALEKAGVPT